MPGRPRKWSLVEPGEQHHRPRHAQHTQRHSHHQNGQQDTTRGTQHQQSHHTTPFRSFGDEGSSVVTPSSSADMQLSVASAEWTSQESHGAAFSGDDFSTLPFLDFNMSGQLDALPLDSFWSCLTSVVHDSELSPSAAAPASAVAASASASGPAAAVEPEQPCDCAKQVFDVMRSLNSDVVSHSMVHTLRQGTDLFDRLLTCPRCYDMSKPPRVTLQNVLLIGRLSLKVTAGYQRYLRWLKDYCIGLTERNMGGDTVYLMLGEAEADSPPLGFRTSSDRFYDLVTEGLKSDAERLADLGGQFAERQRQRHLIGHRECPDQEGRCWKEKGDVDPDPSDVCPQSTAARALIPCYRVVDEVRSKIQQFEDALA